MIYLLHGPDTFTSAARLRELRLSLDPNGFNGVSLDGQETALDALRSACDALPFFGGGRCVDVRGFLTRWGAGKKAEKGKGDVDPLEALAGYLPSMPATTTLLLWEPGPVEPPGPLRRALHDLGATIERFDPPRGRELREWVVGHARELGATIRADAAEALLNALYQQSWREAPRGRDSVPPDLQRLDSELRKLATAALEARDDGPAGAITAHDVTALVVGEVEGDVFRLVDAIAEGNAQQALGRLRATLDGGVVPEVVLALLAGRFSTLARLRSAGESRASGPAVAQRLGISPGRLQHAGRQLAQLGEERVARCLAIVLEADEAIKTGRATRSDDALYWAVLELCRVGPAGPPLVRAAGEA